MPPTSSRYAEMVEEIKALREAPAFRVLASFALQRVHDMTKRDVRLGNKLTDEERGVRLGYIQAFGLNSMMCDCPVNLIEECIAHLEREAKKGG